MSHVKMGARAPSDVLVVVFVGLVAATVASSCGRVTPGSDAASPPGSDAASPSGADAASPTPEAACAALASAQCQKRVSCFDKINPMGTGIIRTFGTMDACIARETLMCMSAFRGA